MRLQTYFALLVLEILALVALMQVPLVIDVIAATGFSVSEVFAGIVGVLVVFQTFIFALTWRP